MFELLGVPQSVVEKHNGDKLFDMKYNPTKESFDGSTKSQLSPEILKEFKYLLIRTREMMESLQVRALGKNQLLDEFQSFYETLTNLRSSMKIIINRAKRYQNDSFRTARKV